MRPTDDPCDVMVGAAKNACQRDSDGSAGGGSEAPDPAASLDPLESFAHSCAKAASWVAHKVGDLIGDPNGFDPTNTGFLQQYAIVFAGSTILVLVVWLVAIAKRAIRGIPMGEALGEAIGFLWLAVGASAFTPLILYTVVQAVSAVTRVLNRAMGGEPGGVFDALGTALVEGKLGGGPVVLIVVSLLVMALCGAVGLLLYLRSLGLYVGALLGTSVYAGLVDKDLWRHVRRWAGVMGSLIVIEPVIVIVIGLAAALQASDEILTGLTITALALGVCISLITKAPGWGDAIRTARQTARAAGFVGGAAVSTAGATAGVLSGIHAHGGRSEGNAGRSSGGGSSSGSASGGVSGGMAAHSDRASSPKQHPKKPKGNDEG